MQFKQLLITAKTTIIEALKVIENGQCQIALVVDENGYLLATLTDGDIRRAILRGTGVNDSVVDAMHITPTVAKSTMKKSDILKIMKVRKLKQIPIIDEYGKLVDFIAILNIFDDKLMLDNRAVIMAGGLGSRLGDLTKSCPKPLLHVGGKPIIDTIISSLTSGGISNIYISVNYMADMIINHCGDGSKYDANITYLKEDKRLGTAGALSLIEDKLNEPMVVTNGDIITKINYQSFIEYHNEHRHSATMAVKQHELLVPYGVVQLDDTVITSIQEKPKHNFFINAGMYVLNPEVIDAIPKNTYYDMTTLFQDMSDLKYSVHAFPLSETWLDIGRLDDYMQADSYYDNIYKLPK